MNTTLQTSTNSEGSGFTEVLVNAAEQIISGGPSQLSSMASRMVEPITRFVNRPWLQGMNDGDQDDFIEYHNPTLALILPAIDPEV